MTLISRTECWCCRLSTDPWLQTHKHPKTEISLSNACSFLSFFHSPRLVIFRDKECFSEEFHFLLCFELFFGCNGLHPHDEMTSRVFLWSMMTIDYTMFLYLFLLLKILSEESLKVISHSLSNPAWKKVLLGGFWLACLCVLVDSDDGSSNYRVYLNLNGSPNTDLSNEMKSARIL